MAASRACGSGTITRRKPRVEAAITIGSTPGTDRRPPVRVSSPITRVSLSASGWTSPQAVSTASAMARSKWVPRFIRSAGDSRIVTRLVAGHGKPELVTAIRTRSRASCRDGSGRPTRLVPGTPGRHVGLDVDQVAEGAVERHRVGGRERHQPSPRTCSISDGPRRGRSTATRSSLRSAGWTSCSWIQAAASRRSRAELHRGDRLVGAAADRRGAGLDLADDEHVTVAQDQVDLAGRAAPVAVEHDQALLDQVAGGETLAVRAEGLAAAWTSGVVWSRSPPSPAPPTPGGRDVAPCGPSLLGGLWTADGPPGLDHGARSGSAPEPRSPRRLDHDAGNRRSAQGKELSDSRPRLAATSYCRSRTVGGTVRATPGGRGRHDGRKCG